VVDLNSSQICDAAFLCYNQPGLREAVKGFSKRKKGLPMFVTVLAVVALILGVLLLLLGLAGCLFSASSPTGGFLSALLCALTGLGIALLGLSGLGVFG
jgi:hypothetical protein